MKSLLRILLPLVILPLLVIFGIRMGSGRHWIVIACAICLCTLYLFYTATKNKRIRSRRMVVTAVLCALSTIGRFIPLLKPITAVTMLGGMYLGPDAGFVIGSFSALLSNMFFGQGPWTPFQMLAWGIIGYLSGLLSTSLKRSRLLLLSLSAGFAFFYSITMDVFTVVWGSGTFTPSLYLASVITALPHTILYAVSNLAFLLLLQKPIGEKLERMQAKYGI